MCDMLRRTTHLCDLDCDTATSLASVRTQVLNQAATSFLCLRLVSQPIHTSLYLPCARSHQKPNEDDFWGKMEFDMGARFEHTIKDYGKARECYERAIEKEHELAMFNLGVNESLNSHRDDVTSDHAHCRTPTFSSTVSEMPVRGFRWRGSHIE